jgi:hypothetical protein
MSDVNQDEFLLVVLEKEQLQQLTLQVLELRCCQLAVSGGNVVFKTDHFSIQTFTVNGHEN